MVSDSHANAARVLRAATERGCGYRLWPAGLGCDYLIGWGIHGAYGSDMRDTARLILRGLLAPTEETMVGPNTSLEQAQQIAQEAHNLGHALGRAEACAAWREKLRGLAAWCRVEATALDGGAKMVSGSDLLAKLREMGVEP